MKQSQTAHRWTVACTHPDHSGVIHDLSEFADGAPEKKVGLGTHKWGGGFRGRPGLLEDLMPIIRAKHSRSNPSHFVNITFLLRRLYRFLDGYERVLKRRGHAYQAVERLHHMTASHLDMMSKPGPDDEWAAAGYSMAAHIRTLILDAIHANELPNIHVPALRRPRTSYKDAPTQEEGMSLIRFLRGQILAILARWQRADRLAAEGRNLLVVPKGKRGRLPSDFIATEADAHATYRALISRTGYPLPTATMLRQATGLVPGGSKPPAWWPRYAEDSLLPGRRKGDLITVTDLSAGLYPTTQDIMLCSLLCLGRSAWNPATLFSLNIKNWCSRYDEQAIWVFAPKGRAGGAYQYTVARVGERTGIYRVVSALIERSATLRSWLKENPDAHPTPDIALRSPWLGMSDCQNRILFTVDPASPHSANRHLKDIIAQHNQSASAKVQVRDMSCGDFRDIAAVWVYRNSRYSMWVTMLLLGHKHLSTTRGYLATRAARQESHALVKSVMDDVLEQIDLNQHWDPTLTRAKVEGFDISPEAKARLDAYRSLRTYDGSMCSDPFHPPRHIDPGHPQDGRARCIQGHRCVASCCPRANVFKESLPWLARRAAELEWTERQLGTVRFSASTDAQDLAELRKTLAQWPEAEVEKEIDYWSGRLHDGTHRALRLAGQH